METCCPTRLPWLDGHKTAPPVGESLRLAAGRAYRIRAGGRVRCVVGNVWVTQEGDVRDIVLSGGEEFTPAARGKVIVQALGDHAVVRLL